MADLPVRYFVFDVESVADGELISKLRYGDDRPAPADAIERYRSELVEKYDSDFIPYTYQFPVSVAVAKVAADFRLIDLVVLDSPQFRPHIITRDFWRGWEAYRRPTLVTFNGRTFDLPLLELAAFRYGVSAPGWFNVQGKSFEHPRHRYNTEAHFDIHDLLTNFGASRFTGGLNLAANILGKPGKMDIRGDAVQDYYNQGRVDEINEYCRCDVLDTYFLFLRCQVMIGRLTLEQEQGLVNETHRWIAERAAPQNAYELYLKNWGDWSNPWDGEKPA
ncbi:MAG: 3'-5' exonuclease [Planctomycetes bacterium]|nr:3'-5' exonuclease [Planctomycetota bacterium]